MIEINDGLVAELKLFIKENYKLISLGKLFSGGKGKQFDPGEIARGMRPKNFGDASDLLSAFVKERRDYEDFAHVLDKLRTEKGLSAADLYKAAWIDKRVYSKIMTTSNYRPAKSTAIAFGLALNLKGDEFDEFLKTAGFSLSESSIFDLTIRFCVSKEYFDLHDVNAFLLTMDQKLLVREQVDEVSP